MHTGWFARHWFAVHDWFDHVGFTFVDFKFNFNPVIFYFSLAKYFQSNLRQKMKKENMLTHVDFCEYRCAYNLD